MKPAFGFRVEAVGKVAVFSGDTMPVQSLVDAAKGADVLISEAAHGGLMQTQIDLLRARNDERNAEIMEEARAYHTSTTDLAKMAADAGVPRLIITHLIPPIPNEDAIEARFVEGMSDIYKGTIEVGRDLKKFTI